MPLHKGRECRQMQPNFKLKNKHHLRGTMAQLGSC